MIALYPGTFDPITNGHLDIITRSAQIFPQIIVAAAESAMKKPLFLLKDRVKMLEISCQNLKNVNCVGFSGLLADFAEKMRANIVIRGLRMISDFEYEMQMAYVNASLNPKLECVFLMPSLQNAFVNSTSVRAIIEHRGKISHLVPAPALKIIQNLGFLCS